MADGPRPPTNEQQRAEDNWRRYLYGSQRGHLDFIATAKECERMYAGGGLQWSEDERQDIEDAERLPTEENHIKPLVDSALGYQIANRMDITLLPRGQGADADSATKLQQVVKQVCDNMMYHFKETDVAADGFIQSRGYLDIRMSYVDSLLGEASGELLDPLDVIPDPDAKSWNPDDWKDVIVTRWYTLDEIEQFYGKAKRTEVEVTLGQHQTDASGGTIDETNSFGSIKATDYWDAVTNVNDTRRVRIIERQYRCYELTEVLVYPKQLDIRPIAGMDEALIEEAVSKGAIRTKRMMSVVRWLVTTNIVVLFDDVSPYPWFTIVPYFPTFRRGITRGMVENAIWPQKALNKAISNILQIAGTAAHSGWIVEEDSLADGWTTDTLKENGGKNGVVITYKSGTTKPEKIVPGQVPAGVVEIAQQSRMSIRETTGISGELSGTETKPDMSGVAIQSRQYAAQQKLATALDMLARFRYLVAKRIVDLVQRFYDGPRIIYITRTSPLGETTAEPMPINMPQEDGSTLNDLTIGEYGIIITEQPMQITFENSQFEQVKSMLELGVPVPHEYVVRYSNLREKVELAKAIADQAGQANPEIDAKVALMAAQTEKTRAEAVNKSVEGMFSATQAATELAMLPDIANLADELLQSAGFEDKNAAPIVPQVAQGPAIDAPIPALPAGTPPLEQNTNPLTPMNPTNPAVGMNEGIEDGVAV